MKIAIKELAFKDNILIQDSSLDFKKGDFINLIGRNGTGKSTFFKLLLGEVPFKGKSELPSGSIVIVSDYAKVPRELKVDDVIKFSINRLNGAAKSEATDLIELLNLKRIQDRKINKLSSGEKRRTEIFVALTSDKQTVIYDEITNALDTGVKKDILAFIKKYHENSTKIAFYTTHDLSEAFLMGGKFWYINPVKKKIEDISEWSEDNIMKLYVYGEGDE